MGAAPLAKYEYLKRRRGKGRSGDRWYVRVVVPPVLVKCFGKKAIEVSLNTSVLKEAQQKRHAVLAKIFADFDRARIGTIASADIQQEAMEYLRRRLDAVLSEAKNKFAVNTDQQGSEFPSAGELELFHLYQFLEDSEWPPAIELEATQIANRYGAVWTEALREELCSALLRAEIQALSRAQASYNGNFLDAVPVLNPRAVDPITGEVDLAPEIALDFEVESVP